MQHGFFWVQDLAVPETNEASVHYGTTLNLIKSWREKEGITVSGRAIREEEDLEEGDLSTYEGSVHSVAETEAFFGNQKRPSWLRQFFILLSRNSKAYRIWDLGAFPVFLVVLLCAILTGKLCSSF